MLLPLTVPALPASDAWTPVAISKVPAPGVHPRILFSPENFPAWKKPLATGAFRQSLLAFAESQITSNRETLDELAALPAEGIDGWTASA